MYNTSFIKKILLIATVVLLYSCDKDFNAIGEELIGDNHFDLQADKYDVIAYNQEVTPVQSNGLPANALGIYDNPVFGTTTANLTTQVSLGTYAPTIGESPVITKVVLSIPYFSHVTTTDPKGGSFYALDSIYGSATGKIKLSVYESGAQMRSSYFDSGSQFAQLYYTDQNSFFSDNKVLYKTGKPLNDSSDKSQNENFFFDAKQQKDSVQDETTKKYTVTYSAPQMRLDLNKDFFQEKILNAPTSKLSSADVFQEYFRGLYFQVEKSDGSPTTNMALIDLAKGGTPATITITYKAKTAITTDDANTTEDKTLVINLSGASTTSLNDVKKTDYTNAVASRNTTTGDDRLYLKGGQGSVALINLFGKTDVLGYDSNDLLVNTPNGVPDELDEIRHNVKTKKWLVNEANLVFYVDADKMAPVDKDEQVKRVYLYDATNNLPIVDYADGTSGSLTTADPKQTRYIFGGILKVDATTKRGISYKVNVTKHMRNLVKDPTIKDVKLGLSVTESIDVFASNLLKLKNDEISQAPRGSVMGPLGTILYGGTANVPADKKLQLEVYYTKPN